MSAQMSNTLGLVIERSLRQNGGWRQACLGKVVPMRAVVFLGDRDCEVRELPDPEPGPGEVRVKMMATGICGSDLHLYRRDKAWAASRGDRVPGHEPCGVVHALGDGVTHVSEGDRVTVYHYRGCGYCSQCAAGNLMWCDSARGYGGPIDGSHADYVITDERNCVKLPDAVSFVDGAFVACPAGTAYASMAKLDVREGDDVAVFGLGPVGLSGVLIAKSMGARVIGVDINRVRLDLARDIGIDAAVGAEAVTDAVREFTGSDGVGLAFETSGSPQGRQDIVASLRRAGKAVFVGIGNDERVVNPGMLVGKQLTLMGSFVLPLWMTWELLTFVEQRNCTFEELVTHRYPIEDAPEAYRTFDAGSTGKVVFEWT